MSEFQTSEEAEQALSETFSRINALHQGHDGRCTTCGYAYPCQTAKAILDFRARFATRYDAVLDALYLSYPLDELEGKEDLLTVLAQRISDIYDAVVAYPKLPTVGILIGILKLISLDYDKATRAAQEIMTRIASVKA